MKGFMINILWILCILYTGTIAQDLSPGKIEESLQGNSKLFKPENYPITTSSVTARANPSLDAPAVLSLLAGMTFVPEKIEKDDHGITWYRTTILNKTIWIPDPFENDAPAKEAYTGYKILILKSTRKLYLQEGNGHEWVTIHEYPIGLSIYADEGPKLFSGDYLTPSGMYYVAGIKPASNYGIDPETHKPLASVHISYPNAYDAWEGLKNGYITLAQYKRIYSQALTKSPTDQNTSLGNWITIHGGGGLADWTWGCVGLENKDMKQLLMYISIEMPIEIR